MDNKYRNGTEFRMVATRNFEHLEPARNETHICRRTAVGMVQEAQVFFTPDFPPKGCFSALKVDSTRAPSTTRQGLPLLLLQTIVPVTLKTIRVDSCVFSCHDTRNGKANPIGQRRG